ncbi:MAG: hypothetical protein IPK79_12555 [Vampirovibrionales bacterium]|nr:hypothetical protein [Vampirovibrionales bacterium]
MAFGKKKSGLKAPRLRPPAMTQIETRTPLGDAFITRNENGALINESRLSPQSAQIVADARDELGALTRSLGRTDSQRAGEIDRAQRELYKLEASGIESDAGLAAEKLRSQLSRRFGGSLNASFGGDLLARMDSGRLNALADARQRAGAAAQEMTAQDEASRLRRANTLMSLLSQYQGQAQSAAESGSSLLTGELRLQAANRMRLLENYQSNLDEARKRRQETLSKILSVGGATVGGALGAMVGNPVLGASLGGAAGRGAAGLFS